MTIEDAQQLQDWGPRYVGLGTWKGLVAACKTHTPPPPPNTHAHYFSDTTEMFSPAQREINGLFGLPVALRVCECVCFI